MLKNVVNLQCYKHAISLFLCNKHRQNYKPKTSESTGLWGRFSDGYIIMYNVNLLTLALVTRILGPKNFSYWAPGWFKMLFSKTCLNNQLKQFNMCKFCTYSCIDVIIFKDLFSNSSNDIGEDRSNCRCYRTTMIDVFYSCQQAIQPNFQYTWLYGINCLLLYSIFKEDCLFDI